MNPVYSCPHGHQWEAPEDGPAEDLSASSTCPECGSVGTHTIALTAGGSATRVENELPPPLPPTGDLGRPRPGAEGRLVFPGYEVLGELGRGGMGVVYQARQLSLNRLVALKLLLSGTCADAGELARFRAEAEAVAVMQHPNIVQVHDIGEHEGRLFCSLEFVDGGSLAAKLQGKPMPARAAAELVETLARAVHAAHRKGIVHRDLKPANVLLTADGTPKITDFGLAKRLDQDSARTATGAVLGTPCYMAPEQAEGRTREVGPHTDVYALGAVLYELLTGRPPFRGESAFRTLQMVVTEEPVPPSRLRPDVPATLEAICLRCLRKAAAARYPSALALADDLRRFADEPVGVPPTAPQPAAGRRGRTGLVAAGVGALVLLVAGVWYATHDRKGADGTPGAPGNGVPGGTQLGAADGPRWEYFRVAADAGTFDRVAFPSRDVGYAASRQGLYKTPDGGQTWRPLPLPAPGRSHFLYFTDDRTGWLGTDRLLRTADGGETWSPVLPAGQMRGVSAFAESPAGWALAGGTSAGGELALFRRREAAGSWERLDGVAAGYWGGEAKPYQRWFLGDLAVAGPRRAVAVLFRGVEEGGALLATEDGGDTWSRLAAFETDVYRVRFSDANHGWLTAGNGLWRTATGGAHWQEPTGGDTPSCVAFDPEGRLGVVPLWNGKVLLKAGDAWGPAEVGADGFGYSMPSAAVVDAGRAYVLAADGRVARYTDPRVPAGR